MKTSKTIKVTFLGTGTSFGVPVIGCKCEICQSPNPEDKRLRTSIKIETEKTCIVVDTGPDFRQQMLQSGTEKLDAVLYTHEHKDHIAGIDDIRAFNWLQKRPMDLYAEVRVQEAIKREVPYVFANQTYPGIPKVNLVEINGKPFKIGDIPIQPIRLFHYKLPVYGFRIGDFAYLTDFNGIPDESMEQIEGVRYLVLEALQHEKHISHLSLPEALHLVEQLKPRETWLTHINHNLGLHHVMNKELPEHVQLAHDGLSVTLDI